MTYCRNHCRGCGGHFTSLRAFDAHRVGPMSDRRCEVGADLVELAGGICAVSDPTELRFGVSVYEHQSADRAREVFGGTEGAQTESTQRKQAVPA